MKTETRLKPYASTKPSLWRKAAEARQDNKAWLFYSRLIAMQMLDAMEQQGITQQQLAERMSCSQQYVSKILKGRENLSLETICKIEHALDLKIFPVADGKSKAIRKVSKLAKRAAVR